MIADIKRRGANCYWDDIPFHNNPFSCGCSYMEGCEREHQAWADGWNQAEREVYHGVKDEMA